MSERAAIKVLLIDNHPLVLDGLRALLETYPHIIIVGAARLAREGLEIARKARPAVILMDINMPQLNGIEAIEMFKEDVPETRILMLSMHDRREYISTSVMHGASGYILKDVSTEEIVEAIEVVADGKTYFSSGVSEVLLKRKTTENALPLTTREHDVLLQIASGKSNRDIGTALGITATTVETHRKNVKKKLNISSTAGLTRYAIENGLIGPFA